MKKVTLLSAVAIAAILGSASASAQTLGVQFPAYYSQPYNQLNVNNYNPPPAYNGHLDSNLTAGVVPQQNWNVAVAATGGGDGMLTTDITNANLVNGANQPVTTFMNSDGSANTTIQFDVSGANVERGGNGNGNGFPSVQSYNYGADGNGYLASGGAFNTSGATTLSLAGLNETDNYTLDVYLSADYYFYGNNGPTISVTLNGSTQYLTMNNASTLTGFTAPGAGSTLANPTLADYVSYTVAGSVLNDNSLSVNTPGVGLAGFQLIDNGQAVPEPSTYVLMGLGLCALVVLRRRAVKV